VAQLYHRELGFRFVASYYSQDYSRGVLTRLHTGLLLLPLELEFFLRPTVSRPVSLGIGPPFGTLDKILSWSSFFI
jgi:hypothetical protein